MPSTAQSIGSPLLWGGFVLFVLGMLALDLGVFHKKAHSVQPKEALTWSLVWVALSLVFCGGIFAIYGGDRAGEFLTGYLIEKALSVDNLFVFVVVFSAFGVAREHQHRILFWGIVGALVMRAAMIFAGAALLERFHFVIYVFGGLLVLTGIRLVTHEGGEVDPSKNVVVRLGRRFLPMAEGDTGGRMLLRQGGRLVATPLLLVLLVLETTDLVFALDSIPAIFAVTRDPFIVFSSNIFAILGLRSLYFLLSGSVDQFRYLKHGLAAVLVFVGGKMLLADVFKIPIAISLGVIVLLIGGAIVASVLVTRREKARAAKGLRPPGGGGHGPLADV